MIARIITQNMLVPAVVCVPCRLLASGPVSRATSSAPSGVNSSPGSRENSSSPSSFLIMALEAPPFLYPRDLASGISNLLDEGTVCVLAGVYVVSRSLSRLDTEKSDLRLVDMDLRRFSLGTFCSVY